LKSIEILLSGELLGAFAEKTTLQLAVLLDELLICKGEIPRV